MFRVVVITLFPQMFTAITEHGITGRAVENDLLKVETINPRDFSSSPHNSVDDRPYGGGPGMVMSFEPLSAAISAAREQLAQARVVYMSPQGKRIEQTYLKSVSRPESELILLAGRYEGVDERLIQSEVDEEWSIGDYVLSGGELAAMVVIDAMSRLIPGVVGHDEAVEQDSFSEGLLDHPHYTRPDSVNGLDVPGVLSSGDHEKIRRWRLKQALGRTWQRRPDLIEDRDMNEEERELLDSFIKEQN